MSDDQRLDEFIDSFWEGLYTAVELQTAFALDFDFLPIMQQPLFLQVRTQVLGAIQAALESVE